jgi:hypothetical protein
MRRFLALFRRRRHLRPTAYHRFLAVHLFYALPHSAMEE